MPVTIETNVPYANVCDVRVTRENQMAVVHFTADPHGGPEAMWFHFRVRRMGDADVRKLRLVLMNQGNLLGGGSDAVSVRPVVRPSRGEWQRLGPGRSEAMPDSLVHAVWETDAPETFVDVALCYPYGEPEVRRLIDESDGYWRSDVIGVSQGARQLLRLSNDYGYEGEPEADKRPGLYLLARQHSGETPGSWVLDGFLRQCAAMGDDAPLIWCVPLTNIDGIEQGDYGKDNFPYDLNRAWSRPAMRHEVLVMQRDMARWRLRCRPALVLDFHAPGMCEDEGVYGFIPPEDQPAERVRALSWTEPMAAAFGPTYASDRFARLATHGSRWPTPTTADYAREALGIVGLTLEVPYSATANGKTLLTIDAYRDAGARLAQAVAERAAQASEPAV